MATPMYTTDRIPDDQKGVTTLAVRAGRPGADPATALDNLERAAADLRPDAVLGVRLLIVPEVTGRTDFTSEDVMRVNTQVCYVAYGTCVRLESE
ncbi:MULTISPECIES: hypothetical protein [Actinomadura]